MGVRVREIDKNSGVFYVFISYKKRRKAHRVGKKKEADYIARQIRKEIAAGNFRFDDEEAEPEHKLTLEQYFKEVDSRHLKAALSESTRQGYENNFRIHMSPALGDIPIHQIDRKNVKSFVADLVSKDLKKASIRKIVAELCAILNRAVEDGYILQNPASRMSKFYKNAKPQKKIVPFSPEEVPTLLQSVKENYPYHFPIFVTFLHAGLRAGELAALRWDDVDFHNRWISVSNSLKRSGEVGDTKTGKVRKVDMSDFLAQVLHAWKTEQEKRYDDLPEWVFTNTEGGKIDLKNLYHRAFQGSMKKAKWKDEQGHERIGLKRRRLHDLRHTFATLLIMNGESLAYVRDQLGHSSITLTVDTYTHWIPGSNRNAVNQLPGLEPVKSKVTPFRKAQ